VRGPSGTARDNLVQLTATAQIKGLNVTYPCLKSNMDGAVVFFIEPGAGIVIAAGAATLAGPAEPVGTFKSGWDETLFVALIGTVTLDQRP
jgi:hypothetical protein